MRTVGVDGTGSTTTSVQLTVTLSTPRFPHANKVGVTVPCEVAEQSVCVLQELKLLVFSLPLRQLGQKVTPADRRELGGKLDEIHVQRRESRGMPDAELELARRRGFVERLGCLCDGRHHRLLARRQQNQRAKASKSKQNNKGIHVRHRNEGTTLFLSFFLLPSRAHTNQHKTAKHMQNVDNSIITAHEITHTYIHRHKKDSKCYR